MSQRKEENDASDRGLVGAVSGVRAFLQILPYLSSLELVPFSQYWVSSVPMLESSWDHLSLISSSLAFLTVLCQAWGRGVCLLPSTKLACRPGDTEVSGSQLFFFCLENTYLNGSRSHTNGMNFKKYCSQQGFKPLKLSIVKNFKHTDKSKE